MKLFKKGIKKVYYMAYHFFYLFINFFSKFGVPLTKNNYKILTIKDQYKGKRCFIIGNGPSLKAEDLEKLKGEITFASNKIYKMFNETKWRPTFYMVVDPIVLEENVEEINSVEAKTKLTLNCYKHLFNADIYFNNNLNKNKRGTFSTNIMESLYSSGTVSYHLLQIAHYMGFSEVYLIGHDYNFKGAVSKTKDLSFLKSQGNEQIYFSENYIRKDEKKPGQAPEEMYKGMEKTKVIYENSGRKILNATRVTYLDVFELRNFDELYGGKND
ncbi:6-hydroxymethylpterin diphosphokinase MptE-like protein [Bacillus sp. SLBN-46]|uniref:6-hydroxymethylpterin diphosphokinase MptE-like protein n=1 Tax=Bacillus sp. SLBN-46 TaxID=3042283 RepID=UPI00286AA544|nr:6-hydroxymethylpterin diphosphokinase MptE-like protein [Bacillus sp. SLBN-46]